MDKLLKALFQLQEFKFRRDDDFFDRLNRQYTPTVFVLFAILVSVKQYVGDVINCWCPAQFTSSHQDYTNTVCWVSDTYYVPMDTPMPEHTEPRYKISYYQWVPLILINQAAFFFTPCVIWRMMNKRSGVNLGAILEAASAYQKSVYGETKEKTIRYMVAHVDGYLLTKRNYSKGACSRISHILSRFCCMCAGRLSGNYLTCTYLMCKVLYIANSLGQLFMLDAFLRIDSGYTLFGLQVLTRALQGINGTISEPFPRVTLCDFQIRQQTNVHRYTVQCVLPINLFNEKIFIFIWFWLLIITFINTCTLIHWLTKALYLPRQVSYIKKQLRVADLRQDNKRDTKAAKRFTEHYLRRDGLLIVRLVSKNAGDLVAVELLHGLWTNYGPERRMMAEPNHTQPSVGNRRQCIRPHDIV